MQHKRIFKSIALLLIIAFSPFSLISQEQSTVQDILNKMEKDISSSQTNTDSISPPTQIQKQMLDDSTLRLYQHSIRSYYDYRVSGFDHRKKVFAWQLYSSKLIFWSVLLLVLAGIAFSGLQFYKSFVEKSSHSNESVTEFEASAKGIKVTSPVLGVIILVISLAFFYLYLVYVYPIREIF